MENSTNNPLSKYFRQPAIYLRLPSDGKYWPEGSLDMPVTRELPVYPLTTRDEIVLRTPDALLNGSGVVDVIHSCVPSIKDAWQAPSVDVDAILIAIRIATYGGGMEINSKCPHCGHQNDNEIDLQTALGTIRCPSYGAISVGDLTIKLKPQAFFGTNRESSISYAEEKMRQALENPDIDPKLRAERIADSIQRLIDISIETITDSTEYIQLTDGTVVSNKQHIKEFYQNTERAITGDVQAELSKISVQGGMDPVSVNCEECNKNYEVPVIFDYSHFFVDGS